MRPNTETVAICGLFCGTCPAYPERCHGCLSDKLTDDCSSCPNGFRDCAEKHYVTRCSECLEFPCRRLEDFSKRHYQNGIGHHETVIPDLQYQRNHSVEEWLNKKIIESTCPICGKLIYWMDKNRHSCSDIEF